MLSHTGQDSIEDKGKVFFAMLDRVEMDQTAHKRKRKRAPSPTNFVTKYRKAFSLFFVSLSGALALTNGEEVLGPGRLLVDEVSTGDLGSTSQ